MRDELSSGTARFPQPLDALGLPWLSTVDLDDMAELAAFAAYKVHLGGGVSRNVGEATVLAWAKVNGGIVVMDERAGQQVGATRRHRGAQASRRDVQVVLSYLAPTLLSSWTRCRGYVAMLRRS